MKPTRDCAWTVCRSGGFGRCRRDHRGRSVVLRSRAISRADLRCGSPPPPVRVRSSPGPCAERVRGDDAVQLDSCDAAVLACMRSASDGPAVARDGPTDPETIAMAGSRPARAAFAAFVSACGAFAGAGPPSIPAGSVAATRASSTAGATRSRRRARRWPAAQPLPLAPAFRSIDCRDAPPCPRSRRTPPGRERFPRPSMEKE